MPDLLTWLKSHKKLIIKWCFILFVVPILAVNFLFAWEGPGWIQFFLADWDAGDILGFIGAFYAFAGTLVFSMLALHQNHVIANNAEKLNKEMLKLEQQKDMPKLNASSALISSREDASVIKISIENNSSNIAYDVEVSELKIIIDDTPITISDGLHKEDSFDPVKKFLSFEWHVKGNILHPEMPYTISFLLEWYDIHNNYYPYECSGTAVARGHFVQNGDDICLKRCSVTFSEISMAVKQEEFKMPVYKEGASWCTIFWYTDWDGARKQKKKRGFPRKKDAQEYEREFQNKYKRTCSMAFSSMVELYMEDMRSRLRRSTMKNKKNLIDTKILSFFGKIPLNEITAAHVRKWQNGLLDDPADYSPTYLKSINNQLSAIFNYAVKYYNLGENPVRRAGSIGKKKADTMDFWTLDEFNQFLPAISNKPDSRVLFLILFYTGMRIGEALALTPEDIDFEAKTIRVDESYQRIEGDDVLGDVKTP